jgi:hypothetical protein
MRLKALLISSNPLSASQTWPAKAAGSARVAVYEDQIYERMFADDMEGNASLAMQCPNPQGGLSLDSARFP